MVDSKTKPFDVLQYIVVGCTPIVEEKVAWYVVKIHAFPIEVEFSIKDRYSSMRKWQECVRSKLSKEEDIIGEFPEKKFFNNLDPSYLD